MPERRRILVLVYNDIRRDARVFRMSRALAERFGVSVIAIAPRDAQSAPDGGFELAEVPLEHTRGAKRLKYILFWLAAIWHGLSRQYNAVHCHDVYPLPVAALLATLRRVPLVYDAHELVDHQFERTTFFGSFWNWWHRWGVRRADHVITPTDERSKFLVERGYRPQRPPVTVMNIADPSAVQAHSDITRDGLGFLQSDHITIYQGYIAADRFSLELLEAFGSLPSEYKLILIGDGPAAAAVQARVRTLGLEERVRMSGYLPKATVLEYLRLADAGVLFYDGRVLNNFYCAPNKLFDYAQLHVPMVGNDLPPIRRILTGWRVGLLVPTRPSPLDIAAALREMHGASWAPQPFQDLLEACNWEGEVKKLHALFQETLSCNRVQEPPARPVRGIGSR